MWFAGQAVSFPKFDYIILQKKFQTKVFDMSNHFAIDYYCEMSNFNFKTTLIKLL